MRVSIFLFMMSFLFLSTEALAVKKEERLALKKEAVKELPAEVGSFGLETILSLTPKKYRTLTGKRLGFFNSIKLRAAQKYIKKHLSEDGSYDYVSADIPKVIYIISVIFGLGFLSMGLLDDWSGSNWYTSLILTLLCWLPGVIYGFVKMREYYR